MSRLRPIYLAMMACVMMAGCATCGSESGGQTEGVDAGGDAGQEISLDASPDSGDDDATDGGVEDSTDGGEDSDVVEYGCGIYQADCDGDCVAISADPGNCGGCDITCGDQQVCSGGQCVGEEECPSGLTACQGSCVDLTWSGDHCGACDSPCGAEQGCVDGQCAESIVVSDPPAFCVNGGPPILLDQQGCAGDLAEATFRWGACGCAGISMNGPLFIDAYDSALGPYNPGGPGGGVGTNEGLSGNESVQVTGTVWTRGDFNVNESSSVGQRLYSGGDVNVSGGGDLTVGSHAYVVGDIQVDTMAVDGTLYVSGASTIDGVVSWEDYAEQEFAVGDACVSCEGHDDFIDVPAIVFAAMNDNDNDLIGLTETALSNSSGADLLHLELPCGRYYLDEIDRNGPTTIVATGNTALFIGEDIHANTSLTITLTPDAQLDIFVAGDVDVGNDFRLGSPNYPALTRLYVGGDSGIGTNSSVQLAGFTYVVPGRFDTNQEIEIFGGIVAQEITTNDHVAIHFDRRIGGMSRGCPDDDPDIDLTCGSGGAECAQDSECCTPLICHEGTCSLLTCQVVTEECSQASDCCSGICTVGPGQDSGVCVVN